ncbi:hypothetical protein MMC08_001124 [Hypocenomyce scalaris]|nr:hypothetical protein [Hypocenomyce scalaris]
MGSLNEKLPNQLFINNEFVNAKSKKMLTVRNPKDNSLVADDIPIAGAEDIDAAVAAAEAAFPAWKKMTPDERRKILLKLADLVDENTEYLSSLSRLTLGSPFEAFGKFESAMCSKAFKYYAGWIDKLAGQSFPAEDGFMKIVRNEPLGVTAGICPWNGPLATIGQKAAPALAAGNCFILKPSEKTPLAALALGGLIHQAGFPPGVFQVLSGDGSTGALLASHMRIRGVSFTGSIPTGKKILEMSAKSNLKRVALELGGKSPAVVFDDCNLDNAVTWCVNALAANTGQVCFAATLVYVQEGIYPKFIEAYKAKLLEKTKGVGDPEDPSTQLGPLVDEAQFGRVSGFIERGHQQGKLLMGGKRVGDKGFFIEPTIFTDVKQDAEIRTQEIFGPVSVIATFKEEDEIIKRCNDSEYGLMAGVFTQDINRALRVASEFESGMSCINCMSMAHMQVPFGGSKQSGIGREMGESGIKEFTERKTILINMTY